MQMKNEGYRDAVYQKENQFLDPDYTKGYTAGLADFKALGNENFSNNQQSFRYCFTKVKAILRQAGVCYAYILPTMKVKCFSTEQEIDDAVFIGIYSEVIVPKFVDIKDDIVESMLEVHNARAI